MNPFEHIRDGFSRAIDSLTEGWHYLQDRASQAVTYFTPTHSSETDGSEESVTARNAARWGLIAAEVKDTERQVQVRLEVPGMNADDFEIQVRGRSLTVAGEKRVEREESQGRYHIMERAYGRFERSIPLPSEVEESGAAANYKNGVLSITLPKTKETLERRIRVTSG